MLVNPTPVLDISCARSGTCETGIPAVRDICWVTVELLVEVLFTTFVEFPGSFRRIPPIIPSMITSAMMVAIKILLVLFEPSFLGFTGGLLPKDESLTSLLPHSSQNAASTSLSYPQFLHFKSKSPYYITG